MPLSTSSTALESTSNSLSTASKEFRARWSPTSSTQTGPPAKSNDGAYSTIETQAATIRNFTPIQDSNRFDDSTLFMPYSVFANLAPGKYAMKIQVEIFDQRNFNRSLATSDYVGFDFTRGSNN